MTDPLDDRSAYAVAAQWVSRIMAVAMEMVLPGLLGLWLDSRLGTRVLFALLGFGVGIPVAVWHLVRMMPTKQSDRRGRRSTSEEKPGR